MKKIESDILFLNHDLRNNIGAAISHLQLLTMRSPELIKDKNITAVVENLYQAINISEEISLSYNNNEKINTELTKESELSLISLKENFIKITRDSYDKLRRMYSIKINDTYELSSENQYIRINQVALGRVRENLINNSIHAGATKIDVHYEMKEYCLVVIFIDNGSGMDQETLDKILLVQQGDGVIHGLGTKSILKTAAEHGFFISYTSEKEKGTTVRALCPYVKI